MKIFQQKMTPLYSNRGVLNTSDLFLDWLSVTFADFSDEIEIFSIFGISPDDCAITRGMLGYAKGYNYGYIKILTDGRKDMGIHVVMSAKALRQIEHYMLHENDTILDFLLALKSNGAKIARIDIAVDLLKELWTIEKLVKEIRKGNLRSKFKTGLFLEKVNLDTGETLGYTIYGGSRTSNTFLRIYDKAKQQGEDDFRIRLELEIKRSNAEIFTEKLLQAYFQNRVGEFVSGVIKNYVEFVEPAKNDSNKSRWPLTSWWQEYLGDVEKVSISKGKKDRNIDTIYDWVNTQVSASLAILEVASIMNEELSVSEIAKNGYKKLKKKDLNMIDNYLKKIEKNKLPKE